MLEILKHEERTMKVNGALETYRTLGLQTKQLFEANKMKELSIGGRMQVRVTVFEVTGTLEVLGEKIEQHFYMMMDSLGRNMTKKYPNNLDEIKQWLITNKFYLSDKEFYQKELGMSEETWEEWNK